MEKLLAYRFEWVLPGHGRIGHADAIEAKRAGFAGKRVLERCRHGAKLPSPLP